MENNIYDEKISYLNENPDDIRIAWFESEPIFKFVGDDTILGQAGCLTMIKNNPTQYKAVIKGKVDEELTQEIANDERIPQDVDLIKVEHLPVFKEWQERIDKLQNA